MHPGHGPRNSPHLQPAGRLYVPHRSGVHVAGDGERAITPGQRCVQIQ